ncbi:MAG: ATP-binding protein [Clostridia bacterium]
MKTKITILLTAVLLVISGLVTITWNQQNDLPESHRVEKGVLDLRHYSFAKKGPLPLNGEWEFFWMQLRAPEPFQTHKPALDAAYIQVPSVWSNEQQIAGKPIDNMGYGTYRLLIRLSESELDTIKALHIPGIASAYQLWIDGKPYAANGHVGVSVEEMSPRYFSRIVYFRPTSTTVELVLYVSNFVQRKAGIWEQIRFGNALDISLIREKRIIFQTLVSGALCIMGVYHVGLFLYRRSDRAPLYLGIICISGSIRNLLTGETLITLLFPGLEWEWIVKVEYISYYVAIILSLQLSHSMFPKEASLRVTRVFQALGVCFTVFALVFPARYYTYTMQAFQLHIIAVFLYTFVIFIRAVHKGREGAWLTLFAWTIIFVAVLNDILYSNQLIRTGYLTPASVLLYLFMQMTVLSMKFANAYNKAESLSDELIQINQSLDERVKQRTAALEEANANLQRANTELRHLEQSRMHLLSNISHELGTPITAIQGYAKAMLDGIISGGSTKYVERIYNKIVMVNRLIQDLLELSRLEARKITFQFVPLRIDGLLDHMYEYFSFDVQEHGLRLELNISPEAADTVVRADLIRIEQVFMNLIYNAIRHSPEGGVISIAAVTPPDDQGSVLITVTDYGDGIAPEAMPYLFDRFYTGEKSRKKELGGTGLGLPITKEIMEIHGGTIRVSSELRRGTICSLRLPAAMDGDD